MDRWRAIQPRVFTLSRESSPNLDQQQPSTAAAQQHQHQQPEVKLTMRARDSRSHIRRKRRNQPQVGPGFYSRGVVLEVLCRQWAKRANGKYILHGTNDA